VGHTGEEEREFRLGTKVGGEVVARDGDEGKWWPGTGGREGGGGGWGQGEEVRW